MSAVLQFGVTPKTKPLSPKRSAMVAALDVGTSKVACLIARLKPQNAQDVLRRRSHMIEVVGFSHTLARGMKAGAVADLQMLAGGERITEPGDVRDIHEQRRLRQLADDLLAEGVLPADIGCDELPGERKRPGICYSR